MNRDKLNNQTELAGKIGIRMFGDLTVDDVRVNSFLSDHLGENCQIRITDRITGRAAHILRDMLKRFPGLENGEDDVNGGDLVEWINWCIADVCLAITEEGLEVPHVAPGVE